MADPAVPGIHAGHIRGLDTWRLVAATWVVLSHFPTPPLLGGADGPHWLIWAATALQGIAFSGPSAVIVFFIISGLCIHYPYAAGGEFRASQFLARRFVRIGLPLAAIIGISPLVGLKFAVLDRMAIWSLFCELIYYALYPVLRIALRHVSWWVLLATAFAGAYAVPLFDLDLASRHPLNPTWGDFPSFGLVGNSVLGFPCWLLGARLAQWWLRSQAADPPTPRPPGSGGGDSPFGP